MDKLRNITKDKLTTILQEHTAWLLDSANGKQADLSSANLRSVNLSYADLRYADLSSANLSYSNLCYADLRYANLSSADLCYADLSSADLSSADLRSANLCYANLSSADLSHAVARLDFGGWSICCFDGKTSIGCITRTNDWWLTATDYQISELDSNALDWWTLHGDAIKAVIKCVVNKAKKVKGD